ncbi:4'-phosphopantetheinyl transferase superfamily protein [Marinobacter sp. M3C]|jgi:enterobactin synthetase component D|uniref:4'-phosphopantetheinyl transferase family protein n=1 Tax=Marinobacter sp. M3C TaxID=2917715 RepID=UPI0020108240|nr:4'-phosphopantetheinyl transferase superfamily protein [Marinobacter sp. M3C]UQG58670.1 4'-phosphopantetheinyl transferase superfamily protein [Marinobacter sp. M3C]
MLIYECSTGKTLDIHSTDNFLSPPQVRWSLPQSLPGALLYSTSFDPTRLADEAFAHYAVEQPASIQRAAVKRRAEFLAGRLCARAGIAHLTGRGETPGLGESRAPVWPAGLCGSITHAGGCAAAIVSRCADWRGLGLDIENLLGEEQAIQLAAEILTPRELRRLAPQEVAFGVTLTFSLKESLFKALYPLTGKYFYFEHAELLEWGADGHARLRLLTDLSAEWCSGRELDGQFDLEDGHLISLVAVPT